MSLPILIFFFPYVFSFLHSAVNSVCFHKENSCVISGSSDRTIKMWDVRSHLLIQHYAAHEAPVTGISLHPVIFFVNVFFFFSSQLNVCFLCYSLGIISCRLPKTPH